VVVGAEPDAELVLALAVPFELGQRLLGDLYDARFTGGRCWNERRTGMAGTGESACRSTNARGGPRVRAQRRFGPLARVWREALTGKSLRSSVSPSTLSNPQELRKVCRRCAICHFLNNAR
jgi:hypothetical protein